MQTHNVPKLLKPFVFLKPFSTLLRPNQNPRPRTLPLLESLSQPHAATNPFPLLAYAITSGHLHDPFAASRVVQFLLSTGHLQCATSLFSSLAQPDAYTWNAMVAFHADRRMPDSAVAFYFRMRASASPPSVYTFALVVKACVLGGGVRGEEVHGQVIKCGAEEFLVVKNSLLSMYSILGLLEDARSLFDKSSNLDTISWNTLISAYGKNGDLGTARELFDEMPERNLVSWSAMIDGYVKNGDFVKALRLFGEMQGERLRPDVVTLVSILKACAQLGALDQGKWVHLYVRRNGIGREGNVVLETALVDMYCKCGCIHEALEVFDGVSSEDVVLWNAMIGGLAMHGHGERALELFQRMQEKGLVPNEATFVGVLCACSHAGRVDDGKEIFESMKGYGVTPQREHYGCLADLLGRAGQVEEAEELLLDMPMEPHAAQWGALMSACRTYNKIEVGERVGKRLIALEPDDGGRYVLLANLYAANGRWEDVRDVRRAMEEKGVSKETGCSYIEWNGTVYEFIVGDKSHPQSREIYALLGEIEKKLEGIGYIKDTSQVLVDMDNEEEKGNVLSYHSEKLAMAFGIINISHELPIRIVKNLRVCRDCHTHAKLVSKVYGREIIVRDRHRFHKFREGLCSCNDYW
ncbi:putative pentatricopeptide repeat-containing protein At5g40405 [Typha angustifolia]|uniref:putative pentatricopeptide repeat-containing protein At5g40405 n=1 Tax=Typha angustifolia TaxID=59011 RepID=UPI003C2BCF95